MSKMSSMTDTFSQFRQNRPILSSASRANWEESTTALNHRNRLFSAGSEGQQRRVVRAAAEASKKQADHELYMSGGGGWVGFYKRTAELVEKYHKHPNFLTLLYVFQILISIICICTSPLQFSSYSLFIFIIQIIISALFIFYRSPKWPYPISTRRMALASMAYQIASAFNTILASIFFIIFQNESYIKLINCCNDVVTQDKCYGSVLTNGTMYMPPTCIEGQTWRSAYEKIQWASWILVPFSFFQAIAHHCGTSVIMEYISQGLLFAKGGHHSAGKVAPLGVSTAQIPTKEGGGKE
ncbi:hypothetical protein HDV05_007247 [Chytridiales sp. JEL 0842]|nr:hypothetical protein HDV05_007247 [Chytridiales sp. JEL 0842]